MDLSSIYVDLRHSDLTVLMGTLQLSGMIIIKISAVTISFSPSQQ